MNKIQEIQERVDKMAYLVKSKEATAIKQLLEDIKFLLVLVRTERELKDESY